MDCPVLFREHCSTLVPLNPDLTLNSSSISFKPTSYQTSYVLSDSGLNFTKQFRRICLFVIL